jgi:hypothetical protein
MLRRCRTIRELKERAARGQSLVEFALVSILLFMLLLGIIDMARLLFTYSVVSNAAQEGARYGIIRPRDVVSASEATMTVTAGGTPYPIPTVLVVADGNCNIHDKARDKIWGVERSQVEVRVWYDRGGNRTPIPVSTSTANCETNPDQCSHYDATIIPGNRVVVEARYRFELMVPFAALFAPNGFDVRMQSARTIMRNGSEPNNCTVNMTPAPSYTPTATRTPTYTRTPTVTLTPTITNTPSITRSPTRTVTQSSTVTNTATQTLTPTAVPTGTTTPTPVRRLVIETVSAQLSSGNNKPLDIRVRLRDDLGNLIAGAAVNATAVGSSTWSGGVTDATGGIYQECDVGSFTSSVPINVTVTASKAGYQPAIPFPLVATIGNWCGQ